MLENHLIEMDCENVLDQTSEKVCLNKSNRAHFSKPTSESLIKQTSDIVFNNQTDKLLKKQIVNQNKSSPVMGKYNLRKKSVQSRSDSIKKVQQQSDRHLRGLKDEESKPRKRNSQLSRYKRKNANARERNRVQEINAAFETLKRILPKEICEQKADDKLTKIATLRSAASYIASLSEWICKGGDLSTLGEDEKSDHQMANQSNHQNGNQSDIQTNDAQKVSQPKIDTLPVISFTSSEELSILSYLSDEENQSDQSVGSQDQSNVVSDSFQSINLTNVLDVSRVDQSMDSTDFTQFTYSTVPLAKPDPISSPSHVNETYDLNNNQTYSISSNAQLDSQSFPNATYNLIDQNFSTQSSILGNLQNFASNQMLSNNIIRSERMQAINVTRSTNQSTCSVQMSVNTKATHDIASNSQMRRKNMFSTPLLNNSNRFDICPNFDQVTSIKDHAQSKNAHWTNSDFDQLDTVGEENTENDFYSSYFN